jgi:hypothetical protein
MRCSLLLFRSFGSFLMYLDHVIVDNERVGAFSWPHPGLVTVLASVDALSLIDSMNYETPLQSFSGDHQSV